MSFIFVGEWAYKNINNENLPIYSILNLVIILVALSSGKVMFLLVHPPAYTLDIIISGL